MWIKLKVIRKGQATTTPRKPDASLTSCIAATDRKLTRLYIHYSISWTTGLRAMGRLNPATGSSYPRGTVVQGQGRTGSNQANEAGRASAHAATNPSNLDDHGHLQATDLLSVRLHGICRNFCPRVKSSVLKRNIFQQSFGAGFNSCR